MQEESAREDISRKGFSSEKDLHIESYRRESTGLTALKVKKERTSLSQSLGGKRKRLQIREGRQFSEEGASFHQGYGRIPVRTGKEKLSSPGVKSAVFQTKTTSAEKFEEGTNPERGATYWQRRGEERRWGKNFGLRAPL